VSASRSCTTPPAVQLNSIFSAKTDPRENPEKNPGVADLVHLKLANIDVGTLLKIAQQKTTKTMKPTYLP
jgi:hypothetical protein